MFYFFGKYRQKGVFPQPPFSLKWNEWVVVWIIRLKNVIKRKKIL